MSAWREPFRGVFEYDFNDPTGTTAWEDGDSGWVTWETAMKVSPGDRVFLVDPAERVGVEATVTKVYASPFVEGAWIIETDYVERRRAHD